MNKRRGLSFEDAPGKFNPGDAPATSAAPPHPAPKNRLRFEDTPDESPLPDASPISEDTSASPDTPGRRLRFEGAETPGDRQDSDSTTSGQLGQKSKDGGKFRRETEQAKPSERLRHDNTPLSGDSAAAPTNAGAAPKADKKLLREGKKLDKSKLRMEKTGDKLEAARDKLAAQKPPAKPGIVKNVGRGMKNNAWMVVHGKIYQAEHENVGIKAAHRTELAGEAALHGASRFVKRRIRTRPTRQVKKWEKRDIKAKADYNFRTAAQENPSLKNKAVYEQAQKKRNRQRFYAQTRAAAKKTAGAAKKVGGAVVRIVAANPKAALIALACLLLVLVIQSCVGGMLTIGNGILGGIGGTSYLAEDGDINGASIAYSEWEIDLLMEAQNAESSYPGYDEYRYFIDPIGHAPHALLSFLTAMYDDFTFAEIEPVLRDIFNQQYELTFTEIVEVRSYVETWTDEDGETHTEIIYYDYYILEVTLTAQPFSDVIGPMLTTQDEQDRFDVYSITKGNRQYVGSPFAFNWLPYVTSHFGWRIHPITGAKDFHRGVDIALPTGTEILAGGNGVVVEAATHSLYGLTIVVDYGDGVMARYSHCSALLVSTGQMVRAGDAIALVGSTGASTGPHLDIEVLKDGELMNPLYFVVIPF